MAKRLCFTRRLSFLSVCNFTKKLLIGNFYHGQGSSQYISEIDWGLRSSVLLLEMWCYFCIYQVCGDLLQVRHYFRLSIREAYNSHLLVACVSRWLCYYCELTSLQSLLMLLSMQYGDQKWCFEGRCQTLGDKPVAIDGQWAEWAAWTDCSRSCGAGVSQSERHCNNPQ